MLLRVLCAVLLLAALRTDAYAHPVWTCGETCNNGEQCNLMTDLNCTTVPAITLAGGADLDFKGKKITCSNNACGTATAAVVVTGASSTIEDTVGGGGVVNFGAAVECGLNSNSIVKKIHIDGGSNTSASGIGNCRKVDSVVLTNMRWMGIVNTSMGSTDYIKDSYILGKYAPPGHGQGVQYGIWVEGTGGLIDHNVIGNVTYMTILAQFAGSGVDITNNMFFSQGSGQVFIFFNSSNAPFFSGNVCSDPNDYYCEYCISSGVCQGPTTPLVLP